jgi:hypothetical protein
MIINITLLHKLKKIQLILNLVKLFHRVPACAHVRAKKGGTAATEKPTVNTDGTLNKEGSNIKQNVDKDDGGGVTFQGKGGGTNQIVYISGNPNENLKDVGGNQLRDDPDDILAHELVGHAIPHIVGSDTGNAVDNENKVRSQEKPGQNQLRVPQPKHTE